jgi:hypothetical protein
VHCVHRVHRRLVFWYPRVLKIDPMDGARNEKRRRQFRG